MTEKTVGYFCGPTLAGIKPSNIVSCYKEQMPDIKEKIVSWNEKLNEKGIYFEPLCECERRILLMVYRKDNMKKILEKTEIAEFLKVYGYIDPKNLETCLCRLKQRISSCEFPHEIGVFLGYPISDIKGFINHRDEGCIFTGEWKVYGDAENAQRIFSQYASCRKEIIRRLQSGVKLAEMWA